MWVAAKEKKAGEQTACKDPDRAEVLVPLVDASQEQGDPWERGHDGEVAIVDLLERARAAGVATGSQAPIFIEI